MPEPRSYQDILRDIVNFGLPDVDVPSKKRSLIPCLEGYAEGFDTDDKDDLIEYFGNADVAKDINAIKNLLHQAQVSQFTLARPDDAETRHVIARMPPIFLGLLKLMRHYEDITSPLTDRGKDIDMITRVTAQTRAEEPGEDAGEALKQMRRRLVKESAAAEQEVACLHDLWKLSLELCDRLQIPVPTEQRRDPSGEASPGLP